MSSTGAQPEAVENADPESIGIECPLCTEVVARAYPIHRSDQLADVFGMSGATMQAMHADQQARRIEQELHRHLAKHTPEEWMPALLEARREVVHLQHVVVEISKPRIGLS